MESKPGYFPFQIRPIISFIFLALLLSSNGLTYILRIYKRSISPGKINLIIILNYYIVEKYNVVITFVVIFVFNLSVSIASGHSQIRSTSKISKRGLCINSSDSIFTQPRIHHQLHENLQFQLHKAIFASLLQNELMKFPKLFKLKITISSMLMTRWVPCCKNSPFSSKI